MRNFLVTLCMLSLLLFASNASAKRTEFNYQGRLNVQGGPFTGQATFRFAIITHDGPTSETVLWVNDDGDFDVLPPVAGVALDVERGLFSVQIGNDDLPNMAPLSPSIFNQDSDLFLRVWVDDGSSGIEQLSPDRKIALPSVIGVRSHTALTLYVDPVNGDDRYPGHKQSHPKKTIQGALDVLPVVLEGVTVVQLAPGTYAETVRVQNFVLSGTAASFTLQGNAADPGSVVIDGTGTGTGLTVNGMPGNSCIKGITVKDFTYGLISRGSDIRLDNLVFDDCEYGVYSSYSGGSIYAMSCTVKNSQWGYFVGGSIALTLHSGEVKTIQHEGVRVHGGSQLTVMGNFTADDCGNDGYSFGIRLMDGASGYVHEGVFKNCSVGALLSSENSFVNCNLLTLTNNGVCLRALRAGVLRYYPAGITSSGNGTLTNSDSISHIIINNS